MSETTKMRNPDRLIRSMACAGWDDWYEDRLGELHHEIRVRMALAKRAMAERDKRIHALEMALRQIKKEDGPGADMSPRADSSTHCAQTAGTIEIGK